MNQEEGDEENEDDGRSRGRLRNDSNDRDDSTNESIVRS